MEKKFGELYKISDDILRGYTVRIGSKENEDIIDNLFHDLKCVWVEEQDGLYIITLKSNRSNTEFKDMLVNDIKFIKRTVRGPVTFEWLIRDTRSDLDREEPFFIVLDREEPEEPYIVHRNLKCCIII